MSLCQKPLQEKAELAMLSDYVLRLLAYYIRIENMVKEKEKKYGEDWQNASQSG